MPKIRLKPNSPEFDDAPAAPRPERHCDMPDCRIDATHKAPRGRDSGEYYHFCLEHVREYNEAWDYFAGMSACDIEDQILKSHYGDRPTWRYDSGAAAENILRDKAWQARGFEEETKTREHTRRTAVAPDTPEGEALAIMGLDPPVTLEDIRIRYRELAKQHHPDLNGGNRESEEILKSINMAYTILKVAYERFQTLPGAA